MISTLQYGVPQDRHRLILIASKREKIPFPEETHGEKPGLKRYATVRNLIGDLPELEAGETDPKDPFHFAAKLSPLNLKRSRLHLRVEDGKIGAMIFSWIATNE